MSEVPLLWLLRLLALLLLLYPHLRLLWLLLPRWWWRRWRQRCIMVVSGS